MYHIVLSNNGWCQEHVGYPTWSLLWYMLKGLVQTDIAVRLPVLHICQGLCWCKNSIFLASFWFCQLHSIIQDTQFGVWSGARRSSGSMCALILTMGAPRLECNKAESSVNRNGAMCKFYTPLTFIMFFFVVFWMVLLATTGVELSHQIHLKNNNGEGAILQFDRNGCAKKLPSGIS